jgi:Transposase DDE domain group 1
VLKVYNGRTEIENRIKEGKNTLRWDKTSCHRFEANQAWLQMGVLAYNLLHMIRQFSVWDEEVKRSMDWLIKRLIKVGARVSYHARRGTCMSPQLFPWRSIIGRCWPGPLSSPAERYLGSGGEVCSSF